jgi:hypothetical protein
MMTFLWFWLGFNLWLAVGALAIYYTEEKLTLEWDEFGMKVLPPQIQLLVWPAVLLWAGTLSLIFRIEDFFWERRYQKKLRERIGFQYPDLSDEIVGEDVDLHRL